MNKKLKFAKIILTLILCLSLSVLAVACGGTEKFTVTFDSDGGTSIVSQTVEKDETINLPTPEKQGFVFDGWYDGQLKMTSPYVVTKNITLKAKWTANQTYTVTFDTDGGSAISAQTVNINSTINLPTPTKTGFNFEGWYDGQLKMTSPYVVIKDVTLRANWISATAQTVDIYFDTNGGNTIVKQTVEKESAVNLPTPEKTGWEFDGWYDGQTKVPQPYVATKTVTLVAHWKAATYTLTYDTNGGQTISSVQDQAYGAVINLPLPTREGYAFDAWYNGNTKVTGQITLTGDVTLTARWKDYNPSNDYNYYKRYYISNSDSIRVVPINFNIFDEICTTEGEYLVYIDSEETDPLSRINFINELANQWGVTIYHFNPDLAGGFASLNSSKHKTNILYDLDEVGEESELSEVQARFRFLLKNQQVDDCSLLAIKAKDVSYTVDPSTGFPTAEKYDTVIAANVSYSAGAEAIASIATPKPGVSSTSLNPDDYLTANIDTYNYYADDSWHMEDDTFNTQKQDVYKLVANYAQFADLLDNNQGMFVVLWGGAWCPNTTAVAKLTNDLAKDYGINTIYNFDPRLDGGAKIMQVSNWGTGAAVSYNSLFVASRLNTRGNDNENPSFYNFNYLFASFMDQYLPGYTPKYQKDDPSSKYTITTNGDKKTYGKVYTPTLMLFDGSGSGTARLVDFVDAEYTWEEISEQNSAAAAAWINAVKELFDKNPYAAYHPVHHDLAVETTVTKSEFGQKNDGTSC